MVSQKTKMKLDVEVDAHENMKFIKIQCPDCKEGVLSIEYEYYETSSMLECQKCRQEFHTI